MKEKEFYNERKDWNFDEFNIEEENFTNWDLIEVLKALCDENTKILDLGTGGGEVVLKEFPIVKEVLGTDFAEGMIETALENLKISGRTDVKFRIMDSLKMDVEKDYYDIVVARNTVTDAKQIYDALKSGGYLLIRGVDKYDCHQLKRTFGEVENIDKMKPVSIQDYENVVDAGFKEVELVPLHTREYFSSIEVLAKFLCKVPIMNDFSNDENTLKEIKMDLLKKYVEENTYEKGIRLLRRYYGIIARK